MSHGTKSYIKGVKVSERHGAGEWVQERLSSLILVPLTLWAVIAGAAMVGQPFETVRAWASEPLTAVLLGLTLIVSVYHTWLGVQVIIEDYLRRASEKAMLALNTVGCLILAAAGLYFIISLAGA